MLTHFRRLLRRPPKKQSSSLESSIRKFSTAIASRDLLDNIVRSMSNLLIVLNPDNTIRMVNPATMILLGYSEAELLNLPFDSICDSRSLASVQNWDTMEDESTSDFGVVLRAKTGKIVHVSLSRAIMRDPMGSVLGVVCVGQDISERKLAEDEKAANNMRYRALFEQSYDGIILMNADGQIEAANKRAAEMLGYTLGELSEMNYHDVTVPREHKLNEDTLRRVQAGELVEIQERLLRRKDGSVFPAEISSKLVVDPHNRPLHLQSIFRDVTQRLRTENEVRLQASLLQNVSDAVISIDHAEGKIETWNRAAEVIYGWSAREAIGQPFNELVKTEAWPEELFKEQYFERGYWTSEIIQTRRDGEQIIVLSSVAMLYDENKKLSGKVMVNHDITARKQAELKAKRLFEMVQGQLVELQTLYERVSGLEKFQTLMMRLANHDLRSTLASVEMSFQQLELEKHEYFKNNHYIHIELIHESLQRARELIVDLLAPDPDVNRHEAIDLGLLTRLVVKQFMLKAVEKSQGLATEITTEKIFISGSRVQIHQVLFNLIDNAIKYTPKGKDITVRLYHEVDKAIFEVTDCGPGIPTEEQHKLFALFSRIVTPETANIPGNGMGLHLVKNIIESHGGGMIVDSIYGQGSTFGFWLPLHEEV